jgi:PEP-utilising enzyme, TIM barrel domain
MRNASKVWLRKTRWTPNSRWRAPPNSSPPCSLRWIARPCRLEPLMSRMFLAAWWTCCKANAIARRRMAVYKAMLCRTVLCRTGSRRTAKATSSSPKILLPAIPRSSTALRFWASWPPRAQRTRTPRFWRARWACPPSQVSATPLTRPMMVTLP